MYHAQNNNKNTPRQHCPASDPSPFQIQAAFSLLSQKTLQDQSVTVKLFTHNMFGTFTRPARQPWSGTHDPSVQASAAASLPREQLSDRQTLGRLRPEDVHKPRNTCCKDTCQGQTATPSSKERLNSRLKRLRDIH